jgi:hypothetical protein
MLKHKALFCCDSKLDWFFQPVTVDFMVPGSCDVFICYYLLYPARG